MNVMQLAWNNARAGAAAHGGKPSDYFTESLKLAQDGVIVKHVKSVEWDIVITYAVIALALVGASFIFGVAVKGFVHYLTGFILPNWAMMSAFPIGYALALMVTGKDETLGVIINETVKTVRVA